MIKKTIYFGHPNYLKCKYEQLVFAEPHTGEKKSLPIEDIGIIILDNSQITITQHLIAKLLENNVALITCNAKHHPTGLLLNLEGNSLQAQKFQEQIKASEPLKKQLWKQTIEAKITNQMLHLKKRHRPIGTLEEWVKRVKSGDSENVEAKASAYYWKTLFDIPDFTRNDKELFPNNLLNYGYAIIRALIARNLVGSGLLPTLGIFHRNQYNAYCLADDIMEPYRPFVDALVFDMCIASSFEHKQLDTKMKKHLLSLTTIDVKIGKVKRPLMLASKITTASLSKCFSGEQNKILYPYFEI